MTATTLDIYNYIQADNLGCEIARYWVDWHNAKQQCEAEYKEIREYLFATDTTQTTNSKLPWKNKTTIPKLTQIRDNLYANYMAVEFPKRKYLDWLADTQDSNEMSKREAILAYMNWVNSQPQFKAEISKCILDYIDYGNCFACVEWVDQRIDRKDKLQVGYVGPMTRRISPFDIVFKPNAPSFIEAPKIIRSLISFGELKKKLRSMSNDGDEDAYKELYNYLKDYRASIRKAPSELDIQDSFFHMDGFDSFRHYLDSDYIEILTFYGDMYDREKDELLENHVIMVADRHKIISKKPNPSYFGYPPIYHVGWRIRQDNLWGMSPLANLVGMQYKIDHIENLKADILDLIAFPVLKIKGYVNDFEWGPMQRIVTDGDGDVEMMAPPFQVLQLNSEVQYYATQMEEMAGAPREAMGFRTPGEKTAYEVQRQENAGSRIFNNKVGQFDDQFMERLQNAMLEMGKRNMQGPQEISVLDDQLNFQSFMTLTPDDLTGTGTVKPLAARHFAERAETVQNLTQFYSSGIGQDPLVNVHISGIKLAQTMVGLLDLTDYALVQPYIRLAEQAQGQRLNAAHQEQSQMQVATPAGLTPSDAHGPDLTQGIPPGPPQQG